MRRCIFAILSAVSLMLCVATVALWVRSYWVSDFTTYSAKHKDRPGGLDAGVASIHGSVGLMYLDTPASLKPSDPMGFRHEQMESQRTRLPNGTSANRWGFSFSYKTDLSYVSWEIWLPKWVIALSLAILPGLWFVSRVKAARKRQRLKRGLCPKCGYDLRASKERCPECGTQIGMKAEG